MTERSWAMATIPVELAQELVDAHPILRECNRQKKRERRARQRGVS